MKAGFMERGLIPNTSFADPNFFLSDILSSASKKSGISSFLQLFQFSIYVLSLQLFWYFIFCNLVFVFSFCNLCCVLE